MDGHHRQGPRSLNASSSARRRGLPVPSRAPGREILEPPSLAASRGCRAGLRARGTPPREQAGRRLRRQALEAVHGAVEGAVEEHLLDLPHEQPFAADRPPAEPPRRRSPSVRTGTISTSAPSAAAAARATLSALHQRERAPPRADLDSGSGCHETGAYRGWPDRGATRLRVARGNRPRQRRHRRPSPKSSWTSWSHDRGEPARDDSRSLCDRRRAGSCSRSLRRHRFDRLARLGLWHWAAAPELALDLARSNGFEARSRSDNDGRDDFDVVPSLAEELRATSRSMSASARCASRPRSRMFASTDLLQVVDVIAVHLRRACRRCPPRRAGRRCR